MSRWKLGRGIKCEAGHALAYVGEACAYCAIAEREARLEREREIRAAARARYDAKVAAEPPKPERPDAHRGYCARGHLNEDNRGSCRRCLAQDEAARAAAIAFRTSQEALELTREVQHDVMAMVETSTGKVHTFSAKPRFVRHRPGQRRR